MASVRIKRISKPKSQQPPSDHVDIDLVDDKPQLPFRKRDRDDFELKPNCKPDGSPIHPEGAQYIGMVDQDGYYTGLGEMTYPDGSTYVGEFLHGYYHGKGTLKYNSEAIYTGEFVNGKRQGKGILKKGSTYQYEGEFFATCCHGPGILITTGGTKYIGSFFESKRHGPMKVVCSDGMIIEGQFYNNQLMYGPLKIDYPDGTKFSGSPSSLEMIGEIRKKLVEYEFNTSPQSN
jgi:hypothetical protein